jgi:hypothetical protein
MVILKTHSRKKVLSYEVGVQKYPLSSAEHNLQATRTRSFFKISNCSSVHDILHIIQHRSNTSIA